ncbi:hypothetical protein V4R08_18095 (plasmid) [Nitrobacter sp. NHB1]
MATLRRGIGRLIDSYAEGIIDKAEFEPRIAGLKRRFSQFQERHQAAVEVAENECELSLLISRLEDFSAKVKEGLPTLIDRHAADHSHRGSPGRNRRRARRDRLQGSPTRGPNWLKITKPGDQFHATLYSGSLKEPSHGWAAVVDWQRISRQPLPAQLLGSRRPHPHPHATTRKSLKSNAIIMS